MHIKLASDKVKQQVPCPKPDLIESSGGWENISFYKKGDNHFILSCAVGNM